MAEWFLFRFFFVYCFGLLVIGRNVRHDPDDVMIRYPVDFFSIFRTWILLQTCLLELDAWSFYLLMDFLSSTSSTA